MRTVSTSSALSIRIDEYGRVRKKSNDIVAMTAATRRGRPVTDDRGEHDHEHEDQRQVRVVDVVAERHQHQRHDDRAEPPDREPDQLAAIHPLGAHVSLVATTRVGTSAR